MAAVLIVDDELDSVEPLARYLHRVGHTVTTTANGYEAITTLTRVTPDVIILDVRMPVMDGAAFIKVMRSYLRWRQLPVIVLTALSENGELDRVLQHGVLRVFRKANVDFVDLAATVQRPASGMQTPENN